MESRYHQFGPIDLDYLRKNDPEMLKFLATLQRLIARNGDYQGRLRAIVSLRPKPELPAKQQDKIIIGAIPEERRGNHE
jgi:hypothetical protein